MFFLNNIPGVNCAFFHIICGNMFGGKTTEMLDLVSQFKRQEKIRVQAAQREGSKIDEIEVFAFKPSLDNRYHETKIVTHDGRELEAISVSSVEELVSMVKSNDFRVIAIDEVQFFKEQDEDGIYEMTKAIMQFLKEDRYIIASGLSKDFRGLPFGPIGELLAIADEITVKNSKCAVCGANAPLPQRFVNGEPADWHEPTIAVGANDENSRKESYEPRCRRCHEVSMEHKFWTKSM